MNERERFFQAMDDLHRYCENPENPLTGPGFIKLVGDFFAAWDDLDLDEPENHCSNKIEN